MALLPSESNLLQVIQARLDAFGKISKKRKIRVILGMEAFSTEFTSGKAELAEIIHRI